MQNVAISEALIEPTMSVLDHTWGPHTTPQILSSHLNTFLAAFLNAELQRCKLFTHTMFELLTLQWQRKLWRNILKHELAEWITLHFMSNYYFLKLTLLAHWNITSLCVDKKGATLFSTITHISWSIFILFAPMETGMNTPESHVTHWLSSLMTS